MLPLSSSNSPPSCIALANFSWTLRYFWYMALIVPMLDPEEAFFFFSEDYSSSESSSSSSSSNLSDSSSSSESSFLFFVFLLSSFPRKPATWRANSETAGFDAEIERPPSEESNEFYCSKFFPAFFTASCFFALLYLSESSNLPDE